MVVEIPTRLFNAALMVAPQAVDEILSAKLVTPAKTPGIKQTEAPDCKTTDKLQAFAHFGEAVVFADAGYAIIDGVALIEITGGLTYRAYSWWTTSYLDIRDSFQAAIADERVTRIALLIDSPGGEVAGLFALVDEIYHARGTKPILAIADEAAFSAAYAIASAADEVYLPATAQVGSIGVIAIHVDQSGYDKNLGLRYTAIFAGDRKNDFNPHEPLKADGKDVLQAHVDKLYDMLTATVARNRGMTQAAVIATQAGFYMGDAAVGAGLADGVSATEELLIKMISRKGETGMNLNEVRDVIHQALAESLSEVKTMLAEQSHVLEGIEARLKEPAPAVPTPIAPADAADPDVAATTAGEIVELCAVAGVPEMAGVMIRDGLSIDEAKAEILDEKAKRAASNNIMSTVGPLSTGEVNPLLEDAKRRAMKKG